MLSSRGGGDRGVASRDSKQSEIRSRISGKQTADSKKERDKLGPGDDTVMKMRVLNSYKQIKFSGVGIGGNATRPTVFSKVGEMPKIPEQRDSSINVGGKESQSKFMNSTMNSIGENTVDFLGPIPVDEITRRDSIFPSDQDGED